MLAVIVVLAVVGTGLWLFSDDKRWGIVALIVLIWGLVIAAFLIARYLRDLRGAEAKEHDLKLVYDLQLEREIAARREYELTVERDVRAEVRAESDDELRELKAEVLALRVNLEELLGRDLGPSYAELLHTAQRQALEESRRSVFDDDDRFNAQSDFAAMPGERAAGHSGAAVPGGSPGRAGDAAGEAIDDYYGSVSEQPGPAAPGPGSAGPDPWDPGAAFPGAPAYVPPPAPPIPGADDESPTSIFSAVADVPAPAEVPDPTLLLPPVGDDEPVDVEPVDVPDEPGQHSSGNTVAELIARMNAGTERSRGGGRRRRD